MNSSRQRGPALLLGPVELPAEIGVGQEPAGDLGAELLAGGNVARVVHAGQDAVVADLAAAGHQRVAVFGEDF